MNVIDKEIFKEKEFCWISHFPYCNSYWLEIIGKSKLPMAHKEALPAVIALLKELESTGNTFINSTSLLAKRLKQAGIKDYEDIFHIYSNGDVTFKYISKSEKVIARRLYTTTESDISIEEINRYIEMYEKNFIKKLDEGQKQAVINCLTRTTSFVTGQAGTGKTTVVKAICYILSNLSQSVILTAPTGKAAKRLNEVTNIGSHTIHRTLIHPDYRAFLAASDWVIVDEFGMVTLHVLSELLSEAQDKNIIFIGDPYQLPPVGLGNVLKEVVRLSANNDNSFNYSELKTIHRQRKGSEILTLSQAILNRDRQAITEMADYFFNNAPVGEIDSNENIILTTTYEGDYGVCKLNERAQKRLGISGRFIIGYKDSKVHLNEQCMILKNNDFLVNGDVAKLMVVNDGTFNFDYNGELVTIEKFQHNWVIPCYCITVHKSQGSEFKNVVLCVDKTKIWQLDPGLLYTAVTRAKENLCITGDKATFINGCMKAFKIDRRRSRFALIYLDKKRFWKRGEE